MVIKFKRGISKSKTYSYKLLLNLAGIIIVVFLIIIIICNWIINSNTKNFLFDDIKSLKHTKTGLVLGTSKYHTNGSLNPFFSNRIKATVDLYQAGKIDFVIVSGDNHLKEYNEPEMMRKELIKSGLPASKIFMDFAGFRTYDSVVRCHSVFGQSSFIIISQKFHNQRAVFIGRYFGLDVVGYNAKNVDLAASLKTLLRECFARVKVFYDIYTDIKPKFLGSKVVISNK